MNTITLLRYVSLLVFTVLSLFLASAAMADDSTKDLASAINLKATGLMMNKAQSVNTAREFSIPVGDGLSTYMDCTAPSRQDPTKKTSKDFRTVIGFHIVLK
ncbi:MAG: hypothetical protein HZB31_10215 [Nitrospirae bacterium]|nr:hypothetical protein [Nitrospirota bacterium]